MPLKLNAYGKTDRSEEFNMELDNFETCSCKQQKTTNSTNGVQSNVTFTSENTRAYRRRYWMLFLFSTLSLLCGTVFPQYVATADVTMCYYGISAEAVNWTSLIFMVVYLVLVFPVSWLIERTGVKLIIIIGAVCNTLSYAVQFAILSPEGFPYVLLTSFLGSLSNVCVLAIPPCLAATWFPSNEVSRACAVGVSGNQLGIALGFVLSPLVISHDCSNKDLISEGKQKIAVSFTAVNAIVLLLILITFQNKPKFPPSISQSEKKVKSEESYLRSSLSMAKNLHFVLIFLMFGLMVGTYFALTTLLNSIVLVYFSDAGKAIGWMGFLFIVTGLVGSVIAGYILDFTHRFKETSIAICALSFIFHLVFCCLLQINKLWLQFITIGTFGFFLMSMLPVGYEYGIEVTYPESEFTSASLLNSSAQIFGIILTEIASYALHNLGQNYAHGILSVALLASTIISCFVTRKYRRCEKDNKM